MKQRSACSEPASINWYEDEDNLKFVAEGNKLMSFSLFCFAVSSMHVYYSYKDTAEAEVEN